MSEKFTFGVLAYNQESEAEMTLNSILYQVREYGKDTQCSLVITDDCSLDATVEVIEGWLAKHAGAFHRVVRRYNTENRGTVDNYLFIMSQIDDEPFKVIAADDLISSNNIFRAFDGIGQHTLYAGFRLLFKQSGVFLEEKHVRMQFMLSQRQYSRPKLLRLFRKGYIISTPQTLYRKSLFTDSEAEGYVKQFRLFEDNPTWYSMIKNVDDIQLTFSANNVALYRISEKSVSNSSRGVSPFKKELFRLYQDYIRDGNLYEKIYFRSAISSLPKLFMLPEYTTRLFYLRCAVYAKCHRRAYGEFRETVLAELRKGEKHLAFLRQSAEND